MTESTTPLTNAELETIQAALQAEPTWVIPPKIAGRIVDTGAILFTHNGQTKSLRDWAAAVGASRRTLWGRIHIYHWPLALALTEKPRG
jgi:hypothetical protein